MDDKICQEYLFNDCPNKSKKIGLNDLIAKFGVECPYCLRRNGKDNNGKVLVNEEQAAILFEVLKDKINV